MLPPSKSEFDQHADGKNLEAQIHAKQTNKVDHEDLVEPGTELDNDVDADLDDADDLGQEVETKPKKKGMGKGIVIAAAGVAVVVALSGAAYFMQVQKPTTVSKKIAVDPSLMEAKPALNSPAVPISSTEVTPNLSAREAASVGPSSSSISAPPSDPFNSSATAAAPGVIITPGTALTPTPTVIITPAQPPAPAVIIIAAPVGNVESPRADPFGAAVVKIVPTPATVEKSPKPVAAPVVKNEKSIKTAKNKAATVDVEEVEIVKPRVVKKVVVKKPSVVRQDMTRSEPHPSQERVQPQSSENFSGYEKLF